MEDLNFEQKSKPELTSEQKRVLGEVWVKVVVDDFSVPEDIEKMSEDELKQWFYETVMKDIGKIVNEFGFEADEGLIAQIKDAKNVDDKSELELDYIRDLYRQIDVFIENFEDSSKKSNRWDSWPKIMRESKQFNCVGATLIGMHFLEQAGIKSYYGNPTGHVVNIVQLPNDELWYVDFKNGMRNFFKLDEERITIKGIDVLKVGANSSDYSFIPLYDNEVAAGSVLSNLSSLEHDANDQKISDENAGKIEAKKILEKYSHNFKKVDVNLMAETLYPQFSEIRESPEMKAETVRVEILWDFEESTQEYLETLSSEKKKDLQVEYKDRKEAIENLIIKEDRTVFVDCSLELKRCLELMLESAKKVKKNYPEFYEEAIEMVLRKIK
jgi:hypothetical protein